MNKQTGVALLAVVVVAGFFYLFGFGNPFPPDPTLQPVEDVTPLEERVVANGVVGAWQSVDDADFIREFKADGTVSDVYATDTAVQNVGTWFTYTKDTAPEGLLFEPDVRFAYVRIVMGGETFDFAVAELSDTNLTIVYLDRGGVLSFTRVK